MSITENITLAIVTASACAHMGWLLSGWLKPKPEPATEPEERPDHAGATALIPWVSVGHIRASDDGKGCMITMLDGTTLELPDRTVPEMCRLYQSSHGLRPSFTVHAKLNVSYTETQ